MQSSSSVELIATIKPTDRIQNKNLSAVHQLTCHYLLCVYEGQGSEG
jgi:hypothetical protein